MATKKVNRMRGQKTHGWGSKKKHRGAGSRGGVGRAGITKHMKLHFKKKGIQVGARGYKSLAQRNIKKSTKSISLRDLMKLADGKKEVILKEHGYDKVLGNGEVTGPVKVIAKSFSKRAIEKIEAAKGSAVRDE